MHTLKEDVMICVFHVSPFDGGWCVKICDTGELLFFKTGGEAERQARKLAAIHLGPSEVCVHDRQGRRIGRWIDGASVLDPAPVPAATPTPTPTKIDGAFPTHRESL
jgi:hypothetical protein